MEEPLKTDYQLGKQSDDELVYKEYTDLMAVPGAMSGAVSKYLMKKYKIHAPSTIWKIRQRMEERLLVV